MVWHLVPAYEAGCGEAVLPSGVPHVAKCLTSAAVKGLEAFSEAVAGNRPRLGLEGPLVPRTSATGRAFATQGLQGHVDGPLVRHLVDDCSRRALLAVLRGSGPPGAPARARRRLRRSADKRRHRCTALASPIEQRQASRRTPGSQPRWESLREPHPEKSRRRAPSRHEHALAQIAVPICAHSSRPRPLRPSYRSSPSQHTRSSGPKGFASPHCNAVSPERQTM